MGRKPPRIVHPGDDGYDKIYNYAARLQNGLCHYCNELIEWDKDSIVVRAIKPPKYYHLPCAEKLNIV